MSEKQKCSTPHPVQRMGQEPCQLKRNVEWSEETIEKENFFSDFSCLFSGKYKKLFRTCLFFF